MAFAYPAFEADDEMKGSGVSLSDRAWTDQMWADLACRLERLRMPWRAEIVTGNGTQITRTCRTAILAEVRAVIASADAALPRAAEEERR